MEGGNGEGFLGRFGLRKGVDRKAKQAQKEKVRFKDFDVNTVAEVFKTQLETRLGMDLSDENVQQATLHGGVLMLDNEGQEVGKFTRIGFVRELHPGERADDQPYMAMAISFETETRDNKDKLTKTAFSMLVGRDRALINASYIFDNNHRAIILQNPQTNVSTTDRELIGDVLKKVIDSIPERGSVLELPSK